MEKRVLLDYNDFLDIPLALGNSLRCSCHPKNVERVTRIGEGSLKAIVSCLNCGMKSNVDLSNNEKCLPHFKGNGCDDKNCRRIHVFNDKKKGSDPPALLDDDSASNDNN